MSKDKPAGFENAESRAKRIINYPEKTRRIADEADEKATKNKIKILEVWDKLTGFIRMMKAWSKGDYKKVSLKTIIVVAAAVLYFLNPFDFIPDFIPFLGYLDDITVIGFVANTVSSDIEKFLDWERYNEA